MKKRLAGLICLLSALFRLAPMIGVYAAEVHRDERIIALTFDDGPHPGNTGRILDVLKKYDVRATFFILGCNAKYYPIPLMRAIEEGHEIENHSMDHKTDRMNAAALEKSIQDTAALITLMTGRRPRYFRPPGGKCTEEMQSAIDRLGYEAIYWTIDSEDWTGKSAESIISSVMRSVRGNDIILFHDYTCPHDNTVEALDSLIPRLLLAGYLFVTIEEMKNRTASRS